MKGRLGSGSIIIVIATDAPLDGRQLRAVALRAAMGMARTGLTSSVGSGDLIVAFSTSRVFERVANFTVAAPKQPILEDDDALDALYTATAEATQAAIYDALFEAKTMTGRNGATVYALPVDRVMEMLRAACDCAVTNELAGRQFVGIARPSRAPAGGSSSTRDIIQGER